MTNKQQQQQDRIQTEFLSFPCWTHANDDGGVWQVTISEWIWNMVDHKQKKQKQNNGKNANFVDFLLLLLQGKNIQYSMLSKYQYKMHKLIDWLIIMVINILIW